MDSLLESNDLLHRPVDLRERARLEGYLFFRGLLDREAVTAVRREIAAILAEAGWLRPGTPPADAIAAEGACYVEPQPEYMRVYNRIMCLESFHALAHQQSLLQLFDTLFGEPTLVHARNIARVIFPRNTKYTTPAHQDYIHIQGTEETWTAWFPLGDCSKELGSLAILPRSHVFGILPTHTAYGAGGQGVDTDHLGLEWAAADFALGDVVVFHSLNVHKGLPNLSEDRIRLSCDFRYQPVSHPVVRSSFEPHHAQLRWEDVYAGWKSDRYQYYWRDLPLKWAEWSSQYHAKA